MKKRSINIGVTYGLSIGVGGAIIFGISLDNVAIGISIGLGSGISFGVALALLLNKGNSC